MKKIQYILQYLLLINICTNPVSSSSYSSAEHEIKKDDIFPQSTIILPAKIEVDSSDDMIFFILLNIYQTIKPENITTEKGNNYVKIDINFQETYYQIILKENEFSIISESNQKIKNTHNTRYTQSSSRMHRQEKLDKYINLDSLKIKVDSKDQTIQIITQYKDMKKNSGINIEFK